MSNWMNHDNKFKDILSKTNDPEHELESVVNTKKELLPHLKETKCWQGLDQCVLEKLEKATTFHSINYAIDMLYDYADENKIWLGFMN